MINVHIIYVSQPSIIRKEKQSLKNIQFQNLIQIKGKRQTGGTVIKF